MISLYDPPDLLWAGPSRYIPPCDGAGPRLVPQVEVGQHPTTSGAIDTATDAEASCSRDLVKFACHGVVLRYLVSYYEQHRPLPGHSPSNGRTADGSLLHRKRRGEKVRITEHSCGLWSASTLLLRRRIPRNTPYEVLSQQTLQNRHRYATFTTDCCSGH